MHDALPSVDVGVGLFEIADPVWLPHDVGMKRDCHDLGALGTFLQVAIKRITTLRHPIRRLVVLENHRCDVMSLKVVRERDERSICRTNRGRLVVVYPIADVFAPASVKRSGVSIVW